MVDHLYFDPLVVDAHLSRPGKTKVKKCVVSTPIVEIKLFVLEFKLKLKLT